VTIAALSAKNLLQILAEPNLLAINNKPASFLAGGEFPYPTVQGGGFGGSVTIAFREFGIRLNFTPSVTPRGTIRLQVAPEVSSLDFANGLVFQGFTIPALSTRRVQTEIELENGQSFAIGGLLDNRMQETFTKIPGLGDLPIIGKLFRTGQEQRNNGELLVTVTPEIVRPMPAGMPRPTIEMPRTFLEGTRADAPQTPGIDQTGPVPVTPPKETMPVEELRQLQQQQSGAQVPQQPVVIMQRPWTMPAGPQGQAPEGAPAAPAPAPAAVPQGN
jgi:pilus assembly protein CpaC